MIKKISIIQYRKLKNIEFSFSKGINIISGTNGTCKTSLLHIISNSFQEVTKNCAWVNNKNCLDVIKKIIGIINPKIEKLTKGDKKYNDPARGHKGTLFSVDYLNSINRVFRRHNSMKNDRFAVKPPYKPGNSEALPYCYVIYLGLSRLFPFGEYQNDAAIEDIKRALTSEYQQELITLYENFTHIKITSSSPQKMGDIKIRADFNSSTDGIDANTISAGEDNLFMILTSLISLKFYYDSISSNNEIESILLIDELDATLHPSYQVKLMKTFEKFSNNYKIQIVFTTHSLSLLEFSLKNKFNVLYLIDNITDVINMDSPDIYKIKMYLSNISDEDIYAGKSIPVFTEDEEARLFLKIIFENISNTYTDFSNVVRFFHLVDANIGATNLINIFSDFYLIKSTMKSICILDGDKQEDMSKCIITLPGGKSPERLIMDYSVELLNNNDPIWRDDTILGLGYGKNYYIDNIKLDIVDIENKIQSMRANGESIHGIARELNKKIFIKHKRFFELLFRHWINNNSHSQEIKKFHKSLYTMFKKVAEFHGINPKKWNL